MNLRNRETVPDTFSSRMRLTEFFCGLGGVAEAVRQLSCSVVRIDVARALDIDGDCCQVYERNFGRAVDRRSIESLDFSDLDWDPGEINAWWLSPPCQPYCRRGRSSPQQDRRCDGLLAILRFLEQPGSPLPHRLALENVPEFARSDHCQRLRSCLRQHGFSFWEGTLCPTQFGVPNRRNRFYLIASRTSERVVPPTVPTDPVLRFSVSEILQSDAGLQSELELDAAIVRKYHTALDIVAKRDPSAVTACFAGGYGKSIIRSGSYLQTAGSLRRFSPREILRLLGFSEGFVFPEQLSTRRRWKMLGNSVSIGVVKSVLQRLADPDAKSGEGAKVPGTVLEKP
ncbi:MAG: DNA cytosine methyltransferase [Novipirellula sp. JB048]